MMRNLVSLWRILVNIWSHSLLELLLLRMRWRMLIRWWEDAVGDLLVLLIRIIAIELVHQTYTGPRPGVEMEVSVLVLVEGGGRDMMVTSGIVEIVSRLVEIVVQVVAGCWTRLGPGLTRPDLIHHQGTFSHFLSISFLRPEVVRTKFFTDTRLGTLGLGFDRLLMFDGTRTRWILDGMRSLILQEVRAVRSGDLLSLGWN